MSSPFSTSSLTIAHLQFAQNGIWEQVETVRPNCFADLHQLSHWLDQAARDVAVEALFMNEAEELTGFVGVRTQDLPSDRRTLMWLRLAALIATTEPKSLDELLSQCLGALQLPTALPATAPTFEMGIFNFWNTAEPLRFKDSPLAELTALLVTGTGPAWLKQGHIAPICLEYVWHQPTHIWLSRNVSTQSEGRYFVDLEQVKGLLQA